MGSDLTPDQIWGRGVKPSNFWLTMEIPLENEKANNDYVARDEKNLLLTTHNKLGSLFQNPPFLYPPEIVMTSFPVGVKMH